MGVAPLPVRGGVLYDARDAGRALRVSAHPELGLVTISLWRDDTCVATHRVPVAEMPELIRLLAATLVETPVSTTVAS